MSAIRLPHFDLLRLLACLMIVAMHAPLPGSEGDGLFLSALSYLTAPGIGLFFMVSGALLLPVKTGTKAFLKRRFVKIAIPTAAWTLFYMACNTLLRGEPLTLRSLLSIPFSAQGTPVLWFIYTLLGLYLLVPILSRWLQAASRSELEFYLCLWGVTLCYPLLKLIVDINTSGTGILYYFTGYVGYFLLGYYLKTYPERITLKKVVPVMAIALAVPVACRLKGMEVDFYSMFWYLSIFVAVQCIFWWKLAVLVTARTADAAPHPLLATVSQLTFGVYLVHIFVMRYVLWRCDFILAMQPYWLQTVTTVVLTAVGSLAVCWLISLLPSSKYVISYDRK